MFRLSVVESFLSAGIPLQKINLRDLLETNGFRLATSSALSELIPTVRMMEMKRLRADLHLPEPVLEMTIAATTQSSLMAAHGVERPLQSLCVLSMIKWEIVHCLVRIDIVAKSVTAEQLAQVLMECLFTDLQLRGHQILATMRDWCCRQWCCHEDHAAIYASNN